MIREFWAENFLSIRERQTVNFETKSKDDEWASVDVGGNKRINKLAVIYGANASGKSNLLLAIQNVFELLFNPRAKRTQPVITRSAFALTQDEPSRLFVSFYANRIRYDYTVSYNRENILHEHMDWYPKGAKALFYERNFVGSESQTIIKFGTSLNLSTKSKEVFTQNTLNNHTVLSVYSKVAFDKDIKEIAELYNWIKEYMHEVNFKQYPLAKVLRSAEKNADTKRFFLKLLKKADFNIVDFYTETVMESKYTSIFANEITPDDNNSIFDIQVETVKAYFLCSAGNKNFTLSLDEQSQGTRKFLSNLSCLYNAITSNHVFLIDEIDSELHDDLLLYFLNVFVLNSDKSQLIFTTQETSLLNEDLLNTHRDFVFIAEKDREGAHSKYTRVDEFGLHKNLSLYNAYKTGRLGAVPQVGSPIIYMDDDED